MPRYLLRGTAGGDTGFLLSRTPAASDGLYEELLDRAAVEGGERIDHPDPTTCGGPVRDRGLAVADAEHDEPRRACRRIFLPKPRANP